MDTVIYRTPDLIRVMRSTTGLQAAIRATVLHDQAVEYEVDGRKLRLGEFTTDVTFVSVRQVLQENLLRGRQYSTRKHRPPRREVLHRGGNAGLGCRARKTVCEFQAEGSDEVDEVRYPPARDGRRGWECCILPELSGIEGKPEVPSRRRGRVSFCRISGGHKAYRPDKSMIGASSKSGSDLS